MAPSALHGINGRPLWIVNVGAEYKRSGGVGPRTIAAALRRSGYDAKYINLGGHRVLEFVEDTLPRIPADAILGLSAISGAPLKRSLELARSLRRRRPDVAVLWGGPHCSAFGELTATSDLADYVAVGDADFLLVSLLSGAHRDVKTQLRISRNGRHCYLLHESKYRSLDDLPILPDYFGKDDLVYRAKRAGEYVVTYETYISRGCFRACTFCYNNMANQRRRYHLRSPTHLSKELNAIGKLGVQCLKFLDDTFPLSMSHLSVVEGWARSLPQPPTIVCELQVAQVLRYGYRLEKLARICLGLGNTVISSIS